MSAWRVLLKKELLDLSRDRRTLVLTVLLPIFLYPGLLLLMSTIIAAGTQRLKNEPLSVALVGAPAKELLLLRAPPKTSWVFIEREEVEQQLADKRIAAAVEAPPETKRLLETDGQAVVRVLYTKRFDRSVEALDRLKPVLESLNAQTLAVRLAEKELEAGFVQPLKLEAVDLDFQKDLGPLLASRLLPTVLLVMLLIGAMYPAVDLTAGERERGTLETLFVSAVRPLDVMVAKYLTVSAAALLSALANLAAMALTFRAGLTLGPAPVNFSLSGTQLLLMLSCMVPTALLMAGLALAVASIARTFKEGQSLMTPLMLAGMTPALLSQMPGVELTDVTALVPLLNVALLIKAAVLGNVTFTQVVLTAVSVLLCALLALFAAARAFRREVFAQPPAGTGRVTQSKPGKAV